MQRSTLCVTLLIYGKVWRTLPSFQWEEGRWGEKASVWRRIRGGAGKETYCRDARGGETRGRQQVHQGIGLKPALQ